jgi:N-acetylglucosaminyldiphosphoundecaprenol N-acetyl-beta-D-mannosaminyltransferase
MPLALERCTDTVVIEDIPVVGMRGAEHLFECILDETRKPGQSVIGYLNVHVANQAHRMPELKRALQRADFVYCDGAGIQWAAKLQGQTLPVRLPAADWFVDLLETMAKADCKVFLLGGEPGIAEEALNRVTQQLPNHSIVGVHHGYFLKDTKLEDQVIAQINTAKPDLLIVGFGTPLQELWIERNRNRLEVSTIYPLGAVMDYLTDKVSRCPQWLGDLGFEWLYRLSLEPQRMFNRYIIGNPWFMGRILFAMAKQQIRFRMLKQLAPLR